MGNFQRFAFHVQRIAGTPWVFVMGVASIVVWLVSGPAFHWSNQWQLIANTVTTLVTFLMGFVVQGALNRQSDEDRQQWWRIEHAVTELSHMACAAEITLRDHDNRLADLQERADDQH